MSWTQVTLQGVNLTQYPEKPLIGFYVGKNEVEGQFGDEVHHFFQKDDGTQVKVYGFTTLNRLLEAIPVGSYVRVIYKGKEKVQTKYGKKEVHQCTVDIDIDRSKSIADSLPSIPSEEAKKPSNGKEPVPAGDVDDDNDGSDLPF
jgi:hypothetical protein